MTSSVMISFLFMVFNFCVNAWNDFTKANNIKQEQTKQTVEAVDLILKNQQTAQDVDVFGKVLLGALVVVVVFVVYCLFCKYSNSGFNSDIDDKVTSLEQNAANTKEVIKSVSDNAVKMLQHSLDKEHHNQVRVDSQFINNTLASQDMERLFYIFGCLDFETETFVAETVINVASTAAAAL